MKILGTLWFQLTLIMFNIGYGLASLVHGNYFGLLQIGLAIVLIIATQYGWSKESQKEFLNK